MEKEVFFIVVENVYYAARNLDTIIYLPVDRLNIGDD